MATDVDHTGFFIQSNLAIFILACSFAGQAQVSQTYDGLLSEWVSRDIFRGASIGACFQDALTGETVAACGEQLSLVPASTVKLWTTATAIEILSPDYRFVTRLAHSGFIRNDSLIGDLIIVGGGDPALGSDYFKDHYFKPHFLQAWADSLKYRGIGHVTGNLLTDDSVYDDRNIADTWTWEDVGNYYGAGPSGLSAFDNLYKVHFRSPAEAGKLTRIKGIEPDIPGLELDNRVLSSNINRDRAYIFSSQLHAGRVLRGTIPKGKSDFVVRGSIPDPPAVLADQFNKILQKNGITLGGKIRAVTQRPDKRAPSAYLASTLSPTLIEIATITNHESVNLFAEHLLKHIAYVRTGLGTTEEGLRILYDFWEEKGLDTQGLFLCDGSGLSRFSAFSCRHMLAMLYYMMNESPYGKAFFRTLPAASAGTLACLSAAKFPNGSLQAKSGSMTRIRSFAGVLHTASGRDILFHVCLNTFSCSQNEARQAIEDLLARFCLL